MLTGHSLSEETRSGLCLLIGYSVSSRLREGLSPGAIRTDVLRYVMDAVHRVGMDEWQEETLVAYAQRTIEACLGKHAARPAVKPIPPLRRAG